MGLTVGELLDRDALTLCERVVDRDRQNPVVAREHGSHGQVGLVDRQAASHHVDLAAPERAERILKAQVADRHPGSRMPRLEQLDDPLKVGTA